MDFSPLQGLWKVSLYVISREGEDRNPILAHIFGGDDLDTALSILTSHLISDAFFRKSFIGSMKWKGKLLDLNYSIGMMQIGYTSMDIELDSGVMEKIEQEIAKIAPLEEVYHLDEIINEISLKK